MNFVIIVDASTVNGNPGFTECRGMNLQTGKIVFSEKIGMVTNNIGEYLAIAYGVNYIAENKLKVPLFSDSKICINWYNKKICKTNFFRDYPHKAEQNKNLAQMLLEADEIIKNSTVPVMFWNKWKHGENPADYGRKSSSTK